MLNERNIFGELKDIRESVYSLGHIDSLGIYHSDLEIRKNSDGMLESFGKGPTQDGFFVKQSRAKAKENLEKSKAQAKSMLSKIYRMINGSEIDLDVIK